MAAIDQAVWVAAALVIAFTLVLISANMTIKIENRQERTASNQEEVIQAVRECWRKEPVQDCFIVTIDGVVTNTSAGVPVEWRATSGKVRMTREQTKVVVAPF